MGHTRRSLNAIHEQAIDSVVGVKRQEATGQFDQSTRAVITRWQAARGYPSSGYLNKLQHKALLTEIVAVAPTASSAEERPKRRATSQAQPQHQAAPQRQYHNSGPDPAGAGRFIGGVVGGMLR